jgi:hypothetical protein
MSLRTTLALTTIALLPLTLALPSGAFAQQAQQLYLVEAHGSMERANTIDAGEGPGPIFGKIADRFHPEAVYLNASRRQIFMIVKLDSPGQMQELMYILTWFSGTEPTFIPVTRPEIAAEAIANAKQIFSPPVTIPPPR